MSFSSADEFLRTYGARIRNEAVQSWEWSEEDDVFGKTHSWSLGSAGVEAIATVDLQATQLTLTITERDIGGAGDAHDNDAAVTFNALIQFEDNSIVLDGGALPYTAQSVHHVIEQFNGCI